MEFHEWQELGVAVGAEVTVMLGIAVPVVLIVVAILGSIGRR